MRTFMSSLPLNTYTPSPLKRTANTLRRKGGHAMQRQTHCCLACNTHAAASKHVTHRCMRFVWYTSRLRPPLYAKTRTERSYEPATNSRPVGE
jgi:hypothetical protein